MRYEVEGFDSAAQRESENSEKWAPKEKSTNAGTLLDLTKCMTSGITESTPAVHSTPIEAV